LFIFVSKKVKLCLSKKKNLNQETEIWFKNQQSIM